jgi:hypothetical protein
VAKRLPFYLVVSGLQYSALVLLLGLAPLNRSSGARNFIARCGSLNVMALVVGLVSLLNDCAGIVRLKSLLLQNWGCSRVDVVLLA